MLVYHVNIGDTLGNVPYEIFNVRFLLKVCLLQVALTSA